MSQNQKYQNVPVHTGRNVPAKSLPTEQKTATVVNLLASQFKAIKSALPKHLTPERVCRVAMNTIRHTPELLDCAPETLVAAIVEASSLGLEIDLRGQAYLVPFRNKKTGRKEVQLIPGYKGLADLAYRSGRVTSIFADVVCENDHFNFSLGLDPKLEHTPNLEERGEPLAVYAVARMKDGDPQFVVLGKSDIAKIRKASQAASGPWQNWESEMWKKTAIRRLCKMLPLSPEIQRAVAIDESADAGISQRLADEFLDIPALETAAPAIAPAEQTAEPQQPAAAPGEKAPAKPAAGSAPPQKTAPKQAAQPEPEPGEEPGEDFFPAGAMTVPCPKKDSAPVDELDCLTCKSRENCPSWE